MKNVFRSVSGLAACVIGVLFATNASAGFVLSLEDFRRTSNLTFEIDVVIEPSIGPQTISTIEMLTYNLTITPANGYSLAAINGVTFNGVRNPTTNALFANPDIFRTINTLQMDGAVISSSGAIPAPSNRKLAFTVLLGTTNYSASDIQINFSEDSPPNRFLGAQENDNSELRAFDGLVSSQPFTVFAVPEPATYVLATIALGGIAGGRRLVKKRRGVTSPGAAGGGRIEP